MDEKIKTRVKFVYLEEPKNDTNLMAIFLDLFWPETNQYDSYLRIGQHGPCNPYWLEHGIPAKPNEYKSLKQELEKIGYEFIDS